MKRRSKMKQKVKLLIENEGKLLLLQPLYKEKYTLIGGTVDATETIIEAGIREGFEESGLDLEHKDFQSYFVSLTEIAGKPTLFYCFYIRRGKLIAELKEREKFQALEWIPMDEGIARLKGVEKKASEQLLGQHVQSNLNYDSFSRVV